MRNILATLVAVLVLSGAVMAQAKTETPKETKPTSTEMKSAEKTEAPASAKKHHHHMKSKAHADSKTTTKKEKMEKSGEKPASEPK
jgi:hypothetical protein